MNKRAFMCIATIAIQQHAEFPLVIVHNRDEFKSRTFKPLTITQVDQDQKVYGGIDLQSDGMWIGVSKDGKIGFITSIRDRNRWDPRAPSRGVLVKRYLTHDTSAHSYFDGELKDDTKFNPFNLVLGNLKSLTYWNSDQKQTVDLSPGIYGLSNAYLDTDWPKVRSLKSKVSSVLKAFHGEPNDLVNDLYKVMIDKTLASPDDLPATGLPKEQELALSSIFVESSTYGTLTTSVIILDAKNRLTFTEFDHRNGQPPERRAYEIDL